MPKYRIVQVAPSSQPKCFRVDEYLPKIVSFTYEGYKNHFTTVKDGDGWAFFNSIEEAESFIEKKLISEADKAKSLMMHTVIKTYD